MRIAPRGCRGARCQRRQRRSYPLEGGAYVRRGPCWRFVATASKEGTLRRPLELVVRDRRLRDGMDGCPLIAEDAARDRRAALGEPKQGAHGACRPARPVAPAHRQPHGDSRVALGRERYVTPENAGATERATRGQHPPGTSRKTKAPHNPRKWLSYEESGLAGTSRKDPGLHGKEGVSGSSPEEGFVS